MSKLSLQYRSQRRAWYRFFIKDLLTKVEESLPQDLETEFISDSSIISLQLNVMGELICFGSEASMESGKTIFFSPELSVTTHQDSASR
jgi:hypothetical protein